MNIQVVCESVLMYLHFLTQFYVRFLNISDGLDGLPAFSAIYSQYENVKIREAKWSFKVRQQNILYFSAPVLEYVFVFFRINAL
jgi:small neutral amino acid transporter SnatA (MarC family)